MRGGRVQRKNDKDESKGKGAWRHDQRLSMDECFNMGGIHKVLFVRIPGRTRINDLHWIDSY